MIDVTAKGVSSLAVAGSGVIIQLQADINIDPSFLFFGFLGCIVSLLYYKDMPWRKSVAGMIVGLVLSIFSSVGLATVLQQSNNHMFAIAGGIISPHVAAMMFGFSGAVLIDWFDKHIGQDS